MYRKIDFPTPIHLPLLKVQRMLDPTMGQLETFLQCGYCGSMLNLNRVRATNINLDKCPICKGDNVSVYYSLYCEDHKEIVDAASELAGGGICPLANATECLWPFMVWHQNCHLRVTNEYEELNPEPLEWTPKNRQELFARKR